MAKLDFLSIGEKDAKFFCSSRSRKGVIYLIQIFCFIFEVNFDPVKINKQHKF